MRELKKLEQERDIPSTPPSFMGFQRSTNLMYCSDPLYLPFGEARYFLDHSTDMTDEFLREEFSTLCGNDIGGEAAGR